jgi:hypothetical protein
MFPAHDIAFEVFENIPGSIFTANMGTDQFAAHCTSHRKPFRKIVTTFSQSVPGHSTWCISYIDDIKAKSAVIESIFSDIIDR